MQKKSTKHYTFVYGTLKGMDRGGRWGSKHSSVEYLGRAITANPTFTLHGGGFPVANRVVSTHPYAGRILGELYLVDDDTLHALDSYEGAPNFYDSEPTQIRLLKDDSSHMALVYLGRSVNNGLRSRPIIVPGHELGHDILHWPFPAEYAE